MNPRDQCQHTQKKNQYELEYLGDFHKKDGFSVRSGDGGKI